VSVVSPGLVKVEARRKVIQHLEGGIVSEIGKPPQEIFAEFEGQVHLNPRQLAGDVKAVVSEVDQAALLARLADIVTDGADEILMRKRLA